MTIGIISAGQIGGAFARRLAQAKLPAILSNSAGGRRVLFFAGSDACAKAKAAERSPFPAAPWRFRISSGSIEQARLSCLLSNPGRYPVTTSIDDKHLESARTYFSDLDSGRIPERLLYIDWIEERDLRAPA